METKGLSVLSEVIKFNNQKMDLIKHFILLIVIIAFGKTYNIPRALNNFPVRNELNKLAKNK